MFDNGFQEKITSLDYKFSSLISVGNQRIEHLATKLEDSKDLIRAFSDRINSLNKRLETLESLVIKTCTFCEGKGTQPLLHCCEKKK